MSQKEKCECASVSAKLMKETYEYQNKLKATFLTIQDDPEVLKVVPSYSLVMKTYLNPVKNELWEIKRVCNIEIPELFSQINEQAGLIDKLDDSADIMQSISNLIVKSDEFKENIISTLDRCEQE